jgi:hypothetical protein
LDEEQPRCLAILTAVRAESRHAFSLRVAATDHAPDRLTALPGVPAEIDKK